MNAIHIMDKNLFPTSLGMSERNSQGMSAAERASIAEQANQ